MSSRILLLTFALSANLGCASLTPDECAQLKLTDDEVREIADKYLKGKNISQEFRQSAEIRITLRECRYEYEEAERLDSFGVGLVVVIDRYKRVVDFYSSE